MNGELAQLIALVTYGNTFLSKPSGDVLSPNNATFKFNEYVRFVDLKSAPQGLSEVPYAGTPSDWYRALQREQCIGLGLSQQPANNPSIPDRHAVAFVGGGQWHIECVLPGGSDFWAARWEIGDQDDPQQKIWRVTYGRVARAQPSHLRSAESCEAQAQDLGAALKAAQAFANEHDDLAHFAENFERALGVLKSPAAPDLDGLAPDGVLPLDAARLLAAAQASWVFGGMGSWNDAGFDGSRQED